MKNCLQCEAEASDETKFCGQCGSKFALIDVNVPEDSLDTGTHGTHAKTSMWIKTIAASLVVLTAMFGYQQFSESKSRECRAQALSNRPTAYNITDVKWGFLGCQFLTSFVNLDSDEARWREYNEVFPSDEALSEARESILKEK